MTYGVINVGRDILFGPYFVNISEIALLNVLSSVFLHWLS